MERHRCHDNTVSGQHALLRCGRRKDVNSLLYIDYYNTMLIYLVHFYFSSISRKKIKEFVPISNSIPITTTVSIQSIIIYP